MTPKELAKELRKAAAQLSKLPDQPIEKIDLRPKKSARIESRAQLLVNLETLMYLRKIPKTEWISFVRDHNLGVNISERDSALNVIWRIIGYLHDHPEVHERIRSRVAPSEALGRAFSVLLEEDD